MKFHPFECPITLSFIFLMIFLLPVELTGQKERETLISPKEFENLTGYWEGELTYLDYSSNKTYSLPITLRVSKRSSSYIFKLQEQFPTEPGANNSSRIRISKDGKTINKKLVISRTTLPDGMLKIVTLFQEKEGNQKRKASVRITYLIGENRFVIRKDVRYKGTEDWIMRNEYRYDRHKKGSP